MTIPNLKRINITSEQELTSWLSKNGGSRESVMLVTHTKASGASHVSHDRVRELLYTYGWGVGRRYVLNKTLIGHVVSKDRK